MKKLLVFLVVSFGLCLTSVAKAFDPISAVVIGSAVLFELDNTGRLDAIVSKSTFSTEPHWSFRDGCKVQRVQVPAAGGGYGYEGYDHCKSLPRVYGGNEFKA